MSKAEELLKGQVDALNKVIQDSKRHQRNHVAAMALQGLLSNTNLTQVLGVDKEEQHKSHPTMEQLAAEAVRAADALIAELEKPVEDA